ncbi:MAG: hypothetical protein RIR00_1398 [Pseudomonadota bacterium]
MQDAPTELFTPQDVETWFSKAALHAGRALLKGVSELDIQAARITALVKGNQRQAFRTIVHFLQTDAEYTVQTICTCGPRFCSHAAAVLLKTIEERRRQDRINPGVLDWIAELHRLADAVAKKKPKTASNKQRLFYVLSFESGEYRGLAIRKGRSPESAEPWSNVERALVSTPQFVADDDLPILRLIWTARDPHRYDELFSLGSRAPELLPRLCETQRLFLEDYPDLPIPARLGGERQGQLGWRLDGLGRQVPTIHVTPDVHFLVSVEPPWFADLESGEVGPVNMGVKPELVRQLLDLPPLTAAEATLVADALHEVAPDVPAPLEDPHRHARLIEVAPVPVLVFDTLETHGNRAWRKYPASYAGGLLDFGAVHFRYQELDLQPDDVREYHTLPEGEVVRVRRQPEAEKAALQLLALQGLERVPQSAFYTFGQRPGHCFGLSSESEWPAFMRNALPLLQQGGWEIYFDEDFRHYVLEVEAWEADLVDSGNGWFDLDMGIIVQGQRLPLAPLLAGLFHRDARWLEARLLEDIPGDESIELRTPDGLRIQVPAERLKPLAATLIDLFDGFRSDGPLRISRFDAPRLAELNNTARWQFHGQSDVLALADKLKAAQGIQQIALPQGLGLELRPYQREGLAWLQFLREQQLSGILADDMGLGKTAQTLAHLLLEKESGRLDRPTLIVLPTSLIFNWKSEAGRFAPSLRVLSLHGPERKSRFQEIPEHDVVLTTYPLLWRDAEELQKHAYHLLILDEAQTVKNARSQGAEAVRRVNSRHRLCLTGTPLENHLGELWSQFDFLLPGFLGDSKQFTRYWRTPIEKQGDELRRDLLARRIRPFILRRKKEDVAQELPPKTVIIRSVELEGSQRDLYETVRAAMDAKVREEIASKGFNRSQIVILDALLKLRQVCCDPRLVKATAARKVKERAKLDLLMAMLPELVEEGRRILVFSQFTTMLGLIEKELQALKIDYVQLTGDTADRESPIRRFQQCEVPVFLISLKAGGVGLNLTAADTVIHYDPWWNPAVENQATDRAHRLGQDKPVFVYKLIVAGSIEEKILALQERKAELAAGILSEDKGVEVKFGNEDIAALFAPLPGG